MDVAQIDLAGASKRVGEQFRIDVDDGSSISLELTAATRANVAPNGVQSDTSFSLTFRGPVEPLLNQGILPMNNDAWGLTHLFLVPVAQDDDGTYYEAVFSRDA